MILGYKFGGHDNGSRMFDQLDGRRKYCTECGRPLGTNGVNPDFVPRRRLDVSSTYDNRTIVSSRVAIMLDGRGGLLTELPRAPGFFELRASDILAFDFEAVGTRFVDRCSTCGRYHDVVGITPVILRKPHPLPLPDRLFRTDLEFGSGDEQNPLLLVGPGLGQELLAAELSGANIKPFGR